MEHCREVVDKISACIDDRLSADEKKELEEHIIGCDSCRKEWEALANLVESIRALPEVELPEDFHSGFMRKFIEEHKKHHKTAIPYKKYAVMAAGLVVTLVMVSILGVLSSEFIGGARSRSSTSMPMSSAASGVIMQEGSVQIESFSLDSGISATASAAQAESSQLKDSRGTLTSPDTGWSTAATANNEKIMINNTIVIECSDVKQTVDAISGLTGYTVSSNIWLEESYESASLVRRVDERNLMYTEEVVRSLGRVVSENSYQQNMTAESAELAVRIKNTREEMDRLTLLISTSNSIDHIIYLENRISELNYRLDNYMGRQNEIEGLAASPYLYVQIVQKPKVKMLDNGALGFNERLVRAFDASYRVSLGLFQNVLIFASMLVMPACVLGILGLVVFFMVRRRSRRSE